MAPPDESQVHHLGSFFGRTYNNLHGITDCKNGGKCVINKKNRTTCKACRLQKCLFVGMSKSGSRYGRRSNWFKIHCLLQEQQTNVNPSTSATVPVAAPSFVPNFMPAFLPHGQQQQANVAYGKSGIEGASSRADDLALQSHLLHVAILKQEHERNSKSPHPDDVALQNHLRLFALQKEHGRLSGDQQQSAGTSSRENTPQQHHQQLQHAVFSMSFPQSDAAVPSSSSHALRSSRSSYERHSDTSESESSVGAGDNFPDGESRSNSVLSSSKPSAVSPTLSEREFTSNTVNATVTLTPNYHPYHNLGVMYPPPGLITPSTSQNLLRGGDLLLVSPSPGGLAVTQDEPIDLSVRASRTSPRNNRTPEDEEGHEAMDISLDDEEESCDTPHNDENTTRSKPLDLTLSVERPAGLRLSL